MWFLKIYLAPSHPDLMKAKFVMVEKRSIWLLMVETNKHTLTHTQMSSIKILSKKKHDNLPISSAIESAHPFVHLVGYFELNFNVMISQSIKNGYINETDVEKIKSKMKNPKRIYFGYPFPAHN